MKIKQYVISIFTIVVLISMNSVRAQQNSHSSKRAIISTGLITQKVNTVNQLESGKRNSRLSVMLNSSSNKGTNGVTDTLNYPLAGTYTLYTANAGGYVTGNNYFEDKVKANYFSPAENCQLSGIIFDFAVAKGGSSVIEFAVWDDNGVNNSPGTKTRKYNSSYRYHNKSGCKSADDFCSV